MSEVMSIIISDKEAEGLLWGLAQIGDHTHRICDDASDPLFILMRAGFDSEVIAETCESLFPHCYTRNLSPPFTELERMILRLAVENSSWVHHYQLHKFDATIIETARQALRTLAAKLDQVGIEVNYLPQD